MDQELTRTGRIVGRKWRNPAAFLASAFLAGASLSLPVWLDHGRDAWIQPVSLFVLAAGAAASLLALWKLSAKSPLRAAAWLFTAAGIGLVTQAIFSVENGLSVTGFAAPVLFLVLGGLFAFSRLFPAGRGLRLVFLAAVSAVWLLLLPPLGAHGNTPLSETLTNPATTQEQVRLDQVIPVAVSLHPASVPRSQIQTVSYPVLGGAWQATDTHLQPCQPGKNGEDVRSATRIVRKATGG